MTGGEGDGVGRILALSSLVPEGKYEVRYWFYETQVCFGAPKVSVHFSIANHDKYSGTPIARHYTVNGLSGPARKYGNFDVRSPNCRQVREFGRVSDDPERLDRISYASFKDKRILVRVRTVKKDSSGNLLGDDEKYSVVAEIIGVIDDETIRFLAK